MAMISKFAALAALALAPLAGRAELVWTENSGWLETGPVSGPMGELDRRIALGLLNSGSQEEAAGNLYTALSRYNEVIDSYPDTAYEAEALFRKGGIHLLRSQFERAFDDYNTILRRHPEFSRFTRVVEAQYAIAMAIRRGERPYLWGWIPWFKDDEKALEFFEKTHEAAPYGPHADWSLYEKGGWAREIDKEDDSLDAYERLIYRYPDSLLTPTSYLAMAELHAGRVQGPFWDQGSTREALNFYKDFIALFPTHEYAPKAQAKVIEMRDTLARNRLELGKFYYYRRNNARAAAIFFNEAVNAAPDSEAAKEAQEMLALARSGALPPRTPVDWVFGRYPRSNAGDFVDAQSQQNLDKLGFRDAPKTEAGNSSESGAGMFGSGQ